MLRFIGEEEEKPKSKPTNLISYIEQLKTTEKQTCSHMKGYFVVLQAVDTRGKKLLKGQQGICFAVLDNRKLYEKKSLTASVHMLFKKASMEKIFSIEKGIDQIIVQIKKADPADGYGTLIHEVIISRNRSHSLLVSALDNTCTVNGEDYVILSYVVPPRGPLTEEVRQYEPNTVLKRGDTRC